MGNTKSKTLTSLPSTDEEEDVAVVDVDTPEQAPPQTSAATTPAISPAEDAKILRQVSRCFQQMKKYPRISTQRQKLCKLRKYCNSTDKAVHYMRHILKYDNGLELILAGMRRHVNSMTIQDHGCRVCTMLARQDANATICTLPVVLAAMKTHKRNTNIQLNGLAALCFWGMELKDGAPINNDNKETANNNQDLLASQVVEAGAYPIIFNTMLTSWHETNFLLQDKALKTLVILTTSGGATSDNRTAFVSASAWKALQSSLSNHSTKAKLQLKGIKILRAVAVEHPAAVSKRGLSMVLSAMKTHLGDAAVQKHGCSLLLLLATNHPPSHDLLWQPGGGRDAILAAMQQHTTHEDIQKTAILALQKLPSQPNDNNHNNNSNDPNSPTTSNTTTIQTAQNNNQTSDAISQGLEAMIASLQKEETPTTTLTNICKALIRLATDSHTNKLDIASAAGVEAILAAMQRNTEAQSLQRYGCQALTQLAAVEATKRAIVQEANAIPAIVQAMETHTVPKESHLVTLHAVLLLVRLSQLLANHAKMMPTVNVLVLAMEVHPDHTQIQHKAMVVLHKLAGRFARFKKPIVKAGGLEVILEAMTQHVDHAQIQRLGCQCLNSLHHRSTSMRMVQLGALNVIVHTMQRHATHIGIQMAAIRAIAEITQFTCHLEHWASQRVNGLPCLVMSIQMHFDNVAFQQLAFRVLQQSSRNYSRCGPYLQRQLVQAGGIGAIMTCMKDHHPDHPVIQQTGFRTLHNLVSRGNAHYGAIIFKNGGWTVVRQAQRVCAEDEFLQRYAGTLLVKLVVMFILHWFLWVAYHVV